MDKETRYDVWKYDSKGVFIGSMKCKNRKDALKRGKGRNLIMVYKFENGKYVGWETL